jgi:hypothetical protein
MAIGDPGGPVLGERGVGLGDHLGGQCFFLIRADLAGTARRVARVQGLTGSDFASPPSQTALTDPGPVGDLGH